MSDIIQYGSSGREAFIPASQQKSIVRRFGDMLTGGAATGVVKAAENAVGAPYVAAFLSSVRGVGEAGVTGAGLGALAAAGAIDYDGVPLDFAGGMGATGLGILMAKSEFGQTLRTCGQTAVGVFAFRQTQKWLGVKSPSVHGEEESWNNPDAIDTDATIDFGEDPILACAQTL